MSQAELSLCPQCGNPVRQSDTKAKQKTCSRCLEQRRIRARLNDEHITRSFATLWARGLYRRLGIFLEARKVPPETQIRMLSKAEYLFQEAEGAFSRLE